MIAKAVVREPNELYKEPVIVPVALPDLDAVRKLAFALHAKRIEYKGEAFGWPVHYYPMQAEPPFESNATFTPATFIMGSWPVWSLSFDWEHGDDQEPLLFVWDKNIVEKSSN